MLTATHVILSIIVHASLQEAAASAANGAPRAEGFELDLLNCAGAWLADATLLLGLSTGQLILVNLQQESGGVKRLKVRMASCQGHDCCCCRGAVCH